MIERWKDIPGYDGKYQASTEGNIRRTLKWKIPESDNFHADGITYAKIDVLNIELYSDEKDWSNEKKIEDILDKYGITYDKTGEYLDSEKMYEVLYEMEV